MGAFSHDIATSATRPMAGTGQDERRRNGTADCGKAFHRQTMPNILDPACWRPRPERTRWNRGGLDGDALRPDVDDTMNLSNPEVIDAVLAGDLLKGSVEKKFANWAFEPGPFACGARSALFEPHSHAARPLGIGHDRAIRAVYNNQGGGHGCRPLNLALDYRRSSRNDVGTLQSEHRHSL